MLQGAWRRAGRAAASRAAAACSHRGQQNSWANEDVQPTLSVSGTTNFRRNSDTEREFWAAGHRRLGTFSSCQGSCLCAPPGPSTSGQALLPHALPKHDRSGLSRKHLHPLRNNHRKQALVRSPVRRGSSTGSIGKDLDQRQGEPQAEEVDIIDDLSREKQGSHDPGPFPALPEDAPEPKLPSAAAEPATDSEGDRKPRWTDPFSRFTGMYRDVLKNERMLAITGSTAITAMCHTALGPVLPIFAMDFGVSVAAVGTTVSAFALARLMLNLPTGVLADKIGRRPLLIAGPAITAVGMIGSGLAGSFTELLLWRFLTGAGSAVQMSGSQLYLADVSSRANRAKTLGTNQVAGLLGVSLGPAIGGLLADFIGLRAPFYAVGAASAAAAVYAATRLPETHPGILKRHAEAAVSAAGASSLEPPSLALAAVPLVPQQSDGSQAEVQSSVATLPPPGWKVLLGSRDFRAIALVNCVLFMTVNGTRAVLMPLLGAEAFGFSPSTLGAVFASMAALNIIGVLPAAAAADKFGRKRTIVPAGLGLGMSLLLMSTTDQLGPEAFWASSLVFAAMNSVIGPSPAAYAADVMPKRSRGLGLGLYRSAGDVGLLLGPPLLGAVADMSSVSTAMCVNAGMLAAASAYFSVRAREVKLHAQKPSADQARPGRPTEETRLGHKHD